MECDEKNNRIAKLEKKVDQISGIKDKQELQIKEMEIIQNKLLEESKILKSKL